MQPPSSSSSPLRHPPTATIHHQTSLALASSNEGLPSATRLQIPSAIRPILSPSAKDTGRGPRICLTRLHGPDMDHPFTDVGRVGCRGRKLLSQAADDRTLRGLLFPEPSLPLSATCYHFRQCLSSSMPAVEVASHEASWFETRRLCDANFSSSMPLATTLLRRRHFSDSSLLDANRRYCKVTGSARC